ncbi:hypothetical protein GLOIN_2v1776597 [Rhizophagus irregularis DAOM 181602=DAOM 197198]|nr:hypothetical protein GLOIN_2v1776597 [Rhizophagus irregularis DAOM 181602=DAOM 197198]
MLQPSLEKSEALYFGINGQVITFAARISFFLADMLEADDITATYKGAQCKMPCHTCMAVGGTELQKKFDDRLRQIPRFPGLKLLHKLGHLNVLTASDYHNIMKIALFALDEIFEGNEITCKELCKLYAKFTKGFGKVLWELTLDNIDQKIKSLIKSENPPHSNFIEGLSQLILTLDTFLDTSSQKSESDEFYIKIYNSVHLKDRHILRTTGEFQGKEWFGNIAVTPAEDQEQYNSNEGAWYGKVSE